jgi:uncharacterized protein (TIGR03000 family)
MYQAVLIAALATSASSPTHCFRSHGCHGCYSCYSCYGCYGGYGGYSGYSGYSAYGCHGCTCAAFGYGAAGGCYGYHGGCYGGFGIYVGEPFLYSTGCYGCYGGYACYGIAIPPDQKTPAPGRGPASTPNPDVKKKPQGEETPTPGEKKKVSTETQVRSKIMIEVPAGSKLFVDNQAIMTEPGQRTFQTPLLTRGQAYFYDIRIEVDGIREERRVVIVPGENATVSFPNLRPGTRTVQVSR